MADDKLHNDENESSLSEEDMAYYKKAMQRRKKKVVVIAAAATLLIFLSVLMTVKFMKDFDASVPITTADTSDTTAVTDSSSDTTDSVSGTVDASRTSADDTTDVSQASADNGISAKLDVEENVGGFPYKIQDGDILSLSTLDGKLLVLTDGGIRLLNKKGSTVMSLPHSYSDPMVKCYAKRGILYDKASGQYRVFNSTGETASGELGVRIITCDINKNRFAIATFEEDSSCALTVYSADGSEKLLEWKCPTDRIVSVSLSPDGKSVSAAVVASQGGVLVSKVYLLDLYMTDTPVPYMCESGASVMEVNYISNDTVAVLTDSSRMLVSQSGEAVSSPIKFDPTLFRCFSDDEDGKTAVSQLSFGALNTSNVVLLDCDNAEQYEDITVNGSIDALHCSEGRIAVLSSSRVYCYAKDGSKAESLETPSACQKILLSVKSVYACTANVIYRFSVSV